MEGGENERINKKPAGNMKKLENLWCYKRSSDKPQTGRNVRAEKELQ